MAGESNVADQLFLFGIQAGEIRCIAQIAKNRQRTDMLGLGISSTEPGIEGLDLLHGG